MLTQGPIDDRSSLPLIRIGSGSDIGFDWVCFPESPGPDISICLFVLRLYIFFVICELALFCKNVPCQVSSDVCHSASIRLRSGQARCGIQGRQEVWIPAFAGMTNPELGFEDIGFELALNWLCFSEPLTGHIFVCTCRYSVYIHSPNCKLALFFQIVLRQKRSAPYDIRNTTYEIGFVLHN